MKDYDKKQYYPSPEDELEDEFYALLRDRKLTAKQWDSSNTPARSAIMQSIQENETRIINIFKEVIAMGYKLNEDMQKFNKYIFPDDLKNDIIFIKEEENIDTMSQLRNNKLPLQYEDVEPLLIKLKDNNYQLTEAEKNIQKHNSYKSQRSKFMKNNRMHKNFKSILEALFDNEQKRIPLGAFYQLLASPSNYYDRVLFNSFIKSCNVSNGKYYERCKKYKVEKFKARNRYKEEIEMHVGLLLRNTN